MKLKLTDRIIPYGYNSDKFHHSFIKAIHIAPKVGRFESKIQSYFIFQIFTALKKNAMWRAVIHYP